MSVSSLVSLRGVGVRAGTAQILRGVSLDVAPGEALGLFGANGSGKTTLLRVMATLIRPAEGDAIVLGEDVSGAGRDRVRRRIGLIGHVPGLYPELTLRENLAFAAKLGGFPPGSGDAALDAVGLAGSADRRVDACSYGMQRRAEFARLLMSQPDLLLLDEPHSALDPIAADLVAALVGRVVDRGGAAVLASHDRARVAAMTGRTVELAGGTLP